MTRSIKALSAFCLLLSAALLANAVRIQVFEAKTYDTNPANRRPVIARYGHPRGDILVGGVPVTGSKDTRQRLRYERTYRDGPLYAPVTGYASQTFGTSLLESAADGVLSGSDTRLDLMRLWHRFTRTPQPAGAVETTIDPAVQRAAYRALHGRTGAVAAVEPTTGEILALVSTPSYDPGGLSGNDGKVAQNWARLTTDPRQPMLNRALSRTYPPGSTFKVVTAAAALEHGIVTDPNARTDTGSPYTLPGTTTRLRDGSRHCAHASLRRALALSCNTVFARLGVRVGLPGMLATARGFGFNDSGLRIPAPVAPSAFGRRLDPAQLALSSIGQFNTAATPLQMAMVAAAVANHGTLMRPYLVDRLTDANGTTIDHTRPVVLRRPIHSRTAEILQRLMVGVVSHGTGRQAALPGAVVGAKTGTAQHGVRNAGVPYAWFIGWARQREEHAPRVAVAVVVEGAKSRREDITGGGDGGPIAREVMRAALRR
ncbi:penicillin-binding transpeptidase domain-containing protein [Streptomyces palmae]|uniref:Penicillin-binding protein 2 n=1 Tax=Streptomyces palmae TaxID=1701085 RepID=A0A4Z0HFB4_9ACTN|nr:penicillin-binding transpeptidase domain-containing protein [Streptomyces palmae]TGB17949.1 penicillin-binding protein 2 [Streptomyces palmae]